MNNNATVYDKLGANVSKEFIENCDPPRSTSKTRKTNEAKQIAKPPNEIIRVEVENSMMDDFLPDYVDDVEEGEINGMSDEEYSNEEDTEYKDNDEDAEVHIKKTKPKTQAEIEAEEEEIRSNPAIMNVLKKMVMETVQSGNVNAKPADLPSTSTQRTQGVDKGKHSERKILPQTTNGIIKSPSDTTIYAPALNMNKGQNKIDELIDTPMNDDNGAKFVNDISTFIESL